MARWGPLVPAPTGIRDLLTISLPSASMTHLEAVEPMSIPKRVNIIHGIAPISKFGPPETYSGTGVLTAALALLRRPGAAPASEAAHL